MNDMETSKRESDESRSRWGENMRAMQVRIKSRFRVAMTSRRLLRQKSRGPAGLVSVSGSPAMRATATGFVVARVFQGNVIFARMARNLAKQEWQKRVGWASSARPAAIFPLSVSSRLRSLLGYSAAGSALVVAEQQQQPPAQTQALVFTSPNGPGYQEVVAAKKDAKKSKAAYYEGKMETFIILTVSCNSMEKIGSSGGVYVDHL